MTKKEEAEKLTSSESDDSVSAEDVIPESRSDIRDPEQDEEEVRAARIRRIENMALVVCLALAAIFLSAALYLRSVDYEDDGSFDHLIDCLHAERSLGDSSYQERPDCREVLEEFKERIQQRKENRPRDRWTDY